MDYYSHGDYTEAMPEAKHRTMHPVMPNLPLSRWITPVVDEMGGWAAFDEAPVGNHFQTADVSALYRFFGDGEDLLYVGVTTNPTNRWRSHAHAVWWPLARFVSIEAVPPAQRLLIEREAIASERPRFNRLGLTRHASTVIALAEGPQHVIAQFRRRLVPEDFAALVAAFHSIDLKDPT